VQESSSSTPSSRFVRAAAPSVSTQPPQATVASISPPSEARSRFQRSGGSAPVTTTPQAVPVAQSSAITAPAVPPQNRFQRSSHLPATEAPSLPPLAKRLKSLPLCRPGLHYQIPKGRRRPSCLLLYTNLLKVSLQRSNGLEVKLDRLIDTVCDFKGTPSSEVAEN